MKPLFTVHAGEYLVGEYIERNFPDWNVWLPSKDTGVDLLVTNTRNRKAVSLQVKFSKDYSFNRSPLLQSRMIAGGWWSLDARKIQKSNADFWIFVLPSFVENEISFIVVPPDLPKVRGTCNPMDTSNAEIQTLFIASPEPRPSRL